LFVSERFDDALKLLEGLGASHPKDAAIQKLRAVVVQEKQKHAQAESSRTASRS